MSNSDTATFELSQFGSWYMFAGIEKYLESAYEVCSCDTLLLELDRLEEWEKENGGFYSYDYVPQKFAELRAEIIAQRDALEEYADAYWDEVHAKEARANFEVIEGGKK